MSWTRLFEIGDLTLTLPLASGLAAGLLAARDRRAAISLALLFALALGIVGVGKVAFLGWGTGIPVLDFKAPSGHAAGVSALFPALLYLLLRQGPAQWRVGAAVAGIALGALVAGLLVRAGEHTPAEAWAGWAVGCAASLLTIRLAGARPAPRPFAGLACGLIVFCGVAWAMQRAQVGYWMIKVALALSGNERPFPWDSCS